MRVVGVSTQQFVYLASERKKFYVNEILVIEDPDLGKLRGVVIEAKAINRYLPLSFEKGTVLDQKVFDSLTRLGFNLADEEVNIAYVRLLDTAALPVKVGSPARVPTFPEVADLLVRQTPDKGLILGEIAGSEALGTLPPEYSNLYCLLENTGPVMGKGVPFIFDYRSMADYPHIGIFGGSGSGKSFGLRVLLEELMAKKIPCLVFDPHGEMEFSEPYPGIPKEIARDYRDRYLSLKIGDEVGIRFSELTTPELVSLLNAISSISESMESAVEALFEPGKDSEVTFGEKIKALLEALENEKLYKGPVPDYLEGETLKRHLFVREIYEKYGYRVNQYQSLKGILWRFESLRAKNLFAKSVAIAQEALLQRKTVVIRGNLSLLKIYSAYLLRKLYYARRNYVDLRTFGETGEYFPPFFIVTDEAHNFAPKGEKETPTRRILREIAQEGRKYGVFLTLATQRPALLDETITAQLSTKFIFRTVRATDISTIREETDITGEEAAKLPYLPSGLAYISSAWIGRTVPVKIRAAHTKSPYTENPFDELVEKTSVASEKLLATLKKFLPIRTTSLNALLPYIGDELGREISYDEIIAFLNDQVEQGVFVKIDHGPFGFEYVLKE
ncbi:ATP-binding protein [Carboxydothermus hydrogenoformans]|uniref:FtsK domain-containing protein n=1 Tax=Carboxydothermus hydrogenoformans (strain ATCC BAA-161 / DSM 6008 / Z-2901) TaxID=246194 RepID=Q3ADJ3_CARHZ|nr:ATP-binding protein [Carboxydothermus hydrogenoformans]ABB14165.1 conserved hypothetical protein [Carboxydothermus hydrogenoformans Z-2901]